MMIAISKMQQVFWKTFFKIKRIHNRIFCCKQILFYQKINHEKTDFKWSKQAKIRDFENVSGTVRRYLDTIFFTRTSFLGQLVLQ